MSSLVTSAVRSVLGKITRSGLDTRRSRPAASTTAASGCLPVPGTRTSLGTVQPQQDHSQIILQGFGAVREQPGEHAVYRLFGRAVQDHWSVDLGNELV